MKLLEEAGWKDTDGDPQTARVAQGVANVPDGTPLSLHYLTTEAPLRKQVADKVAVSLHACGIGVDVQTLNPGDLFAPGPDGLVFGRAFDLVQFTWAASSRPNCLLYTSGQIPGDVNQWIGANISGYSSAAFDAACSSAMVALPGEGDFSQRMAEPQKIFAQELPSIPLYTQVKVALSRPDLCGLDLDVTARSILWNIEAFDWGESCSK